MSTKLPRINVTLDKVVYDKLLAIHKYTNESISKVARDIIEQSIEFQEDKYLSELAENREIKLDTVSHEEVWR